MLAKEDQLSPAAGESTEKVSLHTTPARTQNQLLPAEIQLPTTEEGVPDSTSDLQMTNTSTELSRGGGAPTLQGGQHDRHRRDEGQGYVRLLRTPDPTLQMADAPMNNAAKVDADVNDNPLDEINAGQNSTAEETDTTTPGEETSTNLGGGLGNDKTALATIQDELVKLRAKMIMLKTSQSNLLTRFLELDTKPLLVKTTEPSDPAIANGGALTETATHEPGSIEHYTNAAIATMTNHRASKVGETGTDHQEAIREILKRQNMKQTKAPTMVPKTKDDQVQSIQLIRRSNETQLSMDDRYNKTTTMIKIKTHLYNEDSVTFKPIRLVPINKPLDQSQKYKRASVEIQTHTARAFIRDISHYLTINHGPDSLPPGISISQLDEYDTHPRIVVGKNYKPEVNTIKRVVEEDCMTENEEYVDLPAPG
jgi:hypothetical protein